MNAKAIKIREAWIAEIGEEKYESLNRNIDCDGWGIYPHIQCHEVNYTDSDWESKDSLHIRPKSLQGIETNNGWHRPENDLDIPESETGLYESGFLNSETGEWIKHKFEDTKAQITNGIFSKCVTHYRPIKKHQPPLY